MHEICKLKVVPPETAERSIHEVYKPRMSGAKGVISRKYALGGTERNIHEACKPKSHATKPNIL